MYVHGTFIVQNIILSLIYCCSPQIHIIILQSSIKIILFNFNNLSNITINKLWNQEGIFDKYQVVHVSFPEIDYLDRNTFKVIQIFKLVKLNDKILKFSVYFTFKYI